MDAAMAASPTASVAVSALLGFVANLVLPCLALIPLAGISGAAPRFADSPAAVGGAALCVFLGVNGAGVVGMAMSPAGGRGAVGWVVGCVLSYLFFAAVGLLLYGLCAPMNL